MSYVTSSCAVHRTLSAPSGGCTYYICCTAKGYGERPTPEVGELVSWPSPLHSGSGGMARFESVPCVWGHLCQSDEAPQPCSGLSSFSLQPGRCYWSAGDSGSKEPAILDVLTSEVAVLPPPGQKPYRNVALGKVPPSTSHDKSGGFFSAPREPSLLRAWRTAEMVEANSSAV